jgi:abelson tyrosine-protein kinase 1
LQAAVQILILKLVKANEMRQKEMLESLSHVSPSLAPVFSPLPSAALLSPPADTESVRNTLQALRAEQNAQDRARDMADLHWLMRTALAANDDNAIIKILQIARSEMPDAVRTLERALENLREDEAGKDSDPSLELGNTGAGHSSTDALDRKFIVTGIGALRRLSKGTDPGLPSWTITQFEVELEESVGFGSFSEVFRGTWRKHTVAVKMLDKTTPRQTFLREVRIWKSLHHPNVLELFGASSASGNPPWFLVRQDLSFLITLPLITLPLSDVGLVQKGLQVLFTRKPRQVSEGPEQG